jgi:3D (Asp-Asp-Asp) domain-containing protein
LQNCSSTNQSAIRTLQSKINDVVIAGSLWRKAVATAVAVLAFVALYEVTILDSQFAALRETTAPPAPGARLVFTATAYCKGATTASGVAAQRGVAAADPDLLPVGSVVQVDSSEASHSGIYTIMDTGPRVQGRLIDIYMWSCNEALQFGRRPVHLLVLRLGWNPHATTPSLMGRFFKRPAPAVTPPVPRPPTPSGGAEN